jgi:hypothetical protein
MFVTKIKSMPAAVLVVGLALGGIGVGVGLLTNPAAVAQQPGAKPDDAKLGDDKADWRIRALDDQLARLREVQKQAEQEAARLNERSAAIERTVGELLAQRERFLKKPDGKEASAPRAPVEKTSPTSAKAAQKVLTPEEAITQRPKEKVTVQLKVAAVQDESHTPGGGFGVGFILLKDGGSFSVRLVPPAMYTIMRLDIEPVKHFSGKVVRVTGLVQPDPAGPSFHIRVDDLTQFLVMKE